uniref:Uncharacterized protein LOC114345874 n=1 Tax=Diabrotica virgifera virgifera TaxID=50390 RepID=A0A6P7GRK4_DIAVI
MAASSKIAYDGAPKNKMCKKCKRNLVNGIKCSNCDNYFHVGCAKSSNFVTFLNDDEITCCVSTQPSTESDQAFFDAMETTDKKVSIYEYHFKDAMDSNKWPHGAYVQRFFHLRTNSDIQQPKMQT